LAGRQGPGAGGGGAAPRAAAADFRGGRAARPCAQLGFFLNSTNILPHNASPLVACGTPLCDAALTGAFAAVALVGIVAALIAVMVHLKRLRDARRARSEVAASGAASGERAPLLLSRPARSGIQ
jgi:hypothetical protein